MKGKPPKRMEEKRRKKSTGKKKKKEKIIKIKGISRTFKSKQIGRSELFYVTCKDINIEK